jgi:hypothetical protein
VNNLGKQRCTWNRWEFSRALEIIVDGQAEKCIPESLLCADSLHLQHKRQANPSLVLREICVEVEA